MKAVCKKENQRRWKVFIVEVMDEAAVVTRRSRLATQRGRQKCILDPLSLCTSHYGLGDLS